MKLLLILFFFLIGSFCFVPGKVAYCEASEAEQSISMEVEDVSFEEILKIFSRETGYSVEVLSGVNIADEKFSAKLLEASLAEGVKRILKGYSSFIEINDQEKTMLIRIAPDQEVVSRNYYSALDKSFREKPEGEVVMGGDYEVVPPEEGEVRGITRDELDRIIAEVNNFDPMEVEVVPPDIPGEKSITRGELNELQKGMPKPDPLSVEVVPPDVPGEKGISRGELNALIEDREKTSSPLDIEVVPPDSPGEKGITRRELNRLLEERKQ